LLKVTNFSYPHIFGPPVDSDPSGLLKKDLCISKLQPIYKVPTHFRDCHL